MIPRDALPAPSLESREEKPACSSLFSPPLGPMPRHISWQLDGGGASLALSGARCSEEKPPLFAPPARNHLLPKGPSGPESFPSTPMAGPSSSPSGPISPVGSRQLGLGDRFNPPSMGMRRVNSNMGISLRGSSELEADHGGLIIAMVGLPARGKSFISRKLMGFFQWQCLRTRLFNVGKYRRQATVCETSGRSDFFDSTNVSAQTAREDAALLALDDLLDFIDSGGDVGLFDATNTTRERRHIVVEHARKRGKRYRVLWVELICDDPEVLATNYKNKVSSSPDWPGLTLEEALADFQLRVKKYEDVYETITEDALSYIKLYNMSSKVMVNRIYGLVAKTVMPFLMALHIGTRPIWLVRAGQVHQGLKDDAQLTAAGRQFAARLGVWIHAQILEYWEGNLVENPLKIMSSTRTNAVETTLATLQLCHAHADLRTLRFKQDTLLNPIDRGRIDGSWWQDRGTERPPWEELRMREPQFFAKWQANKLRTRFPGGESYHDVMMRVEACLLQIEASTRPVLCVSNMSCLQVLLSYFQNTPLEDAWDVAIPLHQVIEVVPTLGGGFQVKYIDVSGPPDSSKLEGKAKLVEGSFSDSPRSPRRRSMPNSIGFGGVEDVHLPSPLSPSVRTTEPKLPARGFMLERGRSVSSYLN